MRCWFSVFALVSFLAAAGCSIGGCSISGDDRVPVRDGFTEYRTGAFGFAYPATWRRVDGKDERGRPVLDFNGPALPSGIPEGQVHVARIDDYGGDFDAQLAQFRGLVLLNRYRLTANTRMEVDGARRAQRFEATYELDDGRGTRVPFRLLGMYVLTERRVLVEFMLRSPRHGTSAARLPEIFESFRLHG